MIIVIIMMLLLMIKTVYCGICEFLRGLVVIIIVSFNYEDCLDARRVAIHEHTIHSPKVYIRHAQELCVLYFSIVLSVAFIITKSCQNVRCPNKTLAN